MVGFFEIQLGIIAAFCGTALLFEKYGLKPESEVSGQPDKNHLAGLLKASQKLGMRYLCVYTIVMGQFAFFPCDGDNPRICVPTRLVNSPFPTGSDWLQGPYVYSLYREQYKFTERQVAFLFVTGFIAAGTSGPFVGVWADQ
jgi:MFS transporter, MFS domain-containing protein family, molybdate-anion transporter